MKPTEPSRAGTGRARVVGALSFISPHRRREGLGLWRFFMVLCGFAPLVILVAVRGVEVVPDRWLWVACGMLIVVPASLLLLRLYLIRRDQSPRTLVVRQVEDNRSHVLVYLFATLLPFYRQDLSGMRDLAAILIAVVFIIFLFWYLNLHYVNVFLAVFGFRVYTIRPSEDDANPYASHVPLIIVTRRRFLSPGETIRGHRISDTLYWGLED